MKTSQPLQLKPRSILVIAMRYLGDVLLITPLLHSLRQAYPDVRLDVLVFPDTASMLEGNADISHVITTPKSSNYLNLWRIFRQLFRHYDFAIVTQTGDRPFLYSLFASSFRVAVVPPKNHTGWWKRFFVQRWIEYDGENTHTVLQHLKLLDLIDVPLSYSLVPPQIDNSQQLTKQFPFLSDKTGYVVLHPHPQWTYKQWTVEGWIEIGLYLKKLGLKLVLSGGTAQQEIDYVATIQRQLPDGTINLAGQVSLAQLAFIIAKAKLYIGPDTGITHLAAATGTPVIALYGPTNPVIWAPFPYGYQASVNPFSKKGDQHVNNVFLVQGEGECVPCHKEGCEGHRLSHSDCLNSLSAKKIQDIAFSILQKESSA